MKTTATSVLLAIALFFVASSYADDDSIHKLIRRRLSKKLKGDWTCCDESQRGHCVGPEQYTPVDARRMNCLCPGDLDENGAHPCKLRCCTEKQRKKICSGMTQITPPGEYQVICICPGDAKVTPDGETRYPCKDFNIY